MSLALEETWFLSILSLFRNLGVGRDSRYKFPTAAVTNFQKLSDFKQLNLLAQRYGIQMSKKQFYRVKTKFPAGLDFLLNFKKINICISYF